MSALSKKWGELTDKQKERFGSKAEFKAHKQNKKDKDLGGTKEARADAHERVQKRLESGKNVNVSNIAKKSGISEERAQIIVNRGGLTKKEYKEKNEPLQTPVIPSNTSEEPKVGPSQFLQADNKFGKKDIKHLMSDAGGGLTTDEVQKKINSYQNDPNVKVGLKAQAFLDKKIEEVKASTETPSPAPTPQPTPQPEPAPTPPPSPINIEPDPIQVPDIVPGASVNVENTIKASDNDFTNNGVFTGDNLQGVDMSVNTQGGTPVTMYNPAPTPAPTPPSVPASAPAPAPTPAPTPNATFKPTSMPDPVSSPSMNLTSTVKASDNDFINNGTFVGNNLQGVDMSVNISGSSSNNIKSAADFMALNDNALRKSQAELSGTSRSAQQIEQAKLQTNSAESIANTDYVSRINSLYMGNNATQSQLALYGDLFNFEAPVWKAPKPGKKPEDKTDEIANMYK